jgi:hypothetical protein
VLDLEPPSTAVFHSRLVLSRPDQHVAWRGDSLPADPLALIDLSAAPANQVRGKRINQGFEPG